MTNTIRNLASALCVAGSMALLAGAISGCAGSAYHRSTGTYMDDKTISAKVKTELYADPQVKGTQVGITTYQGKVLLSGFVDSEAQKDRAAEITRRVKGVQWVKNDLVVKNTAPGTMGATAGMTNRIQEPAGTANPPPAPPPAPEVKPAPEPSPAPAPQP